MVDRAARGLAGQLTAVDPMVMFVIVQAPCVPLAAPDGVFALEAATKFPLVSAWRTCIVPAGFRPAMKTVCCAHAPTASAATKAKTNHHWIRRWFKDMQGS